RAVGPVRRDARTAEIVVRGIGSTEHPVKVSYIVLTMRAYVHPETRERRGSRRYSTTASLNPVRATSANVTRFCSWKRAKQSATRRSTSRKLPVVKCEPRGIANRRIKRSNSLLVQMRTDDSARLTRLP